jgi:hypothetical protein
MYQSYLIVTVELPLFFSSVVVVPRWI